jgi:hypothetical protein
MRTSESRATPVLLLLTRADDSGELPGTVEFFVTYCKHKYAGRGGILHVMIAPPAETDFWKTETAVDGDFICRYVHGMGERDVENIRASLALLSTQYQELFEQLISAGVATRMSNAVIQVITVDMAGAQLLSDLGIRTPLPDGVSLETRSLTAYEQTRGQAYPYRRIALFIIDDRMYDAEFFTASALYRSIQSNVASAITTGIVTTDYTDSPPNPSFADRLRTLLPDISVLKVGRNGTDEWGHNAIPMQQMLYQLIHHA